MYYKIPKDELEDILCDAYRFRALDCGGVDNWEWYSESIHNFCHEDCTNSIEELVDKDMTNGHYAKFMIKDN